MNSFGILFSKLKTYSSDRFSELWFVFLTVATNWLNHQLRAAVDAQNAKERRDFEKESRRLRAARQAKCTHQSRSGQSSINLAHNFPDGLPRGICVICHDWITPKVQDVNNL